MRRKRRQKRTRKGRRKEREELIGEQRIKQRRREE